MKGISLSIPLYYDHEFGPYKMTKDIPSTVKNNLKNLLLCAPGEKIMDAHFGVGIRELLFSNSTENLREIISQRIISNISKYMPFVSVSNILVDDGQIDDHILSIRLEYNVPSLNISDFIDETIIKN